MDYMVCMPLEDSCNANWARVMPTHSGALVQWNESRFWVCSHVAYILQTVHLHVENPQRNTAAAKLKGFTHCRNLHYILFRDSPLEWVDKPAPQSEEKELNMR